MMSTDPNVLAKFRVTTSSHKHYSHVRKRCACNRVVTARQLERYGKCDRCYQEARQAMTTPIRMPHVAAHPRDLQQTATDRGRLTPSHIKAAQATRSP